MLGFRVLGDQQLNERMKQRFASLPTVLFDQQSHCPASTRFLILTCNVGLRSWVSKWDVVSLHHPHIYDPGIQHEHGSNLDHRAPLIGEHLWRNPYPILFSPLDR